MAPSRRLSLKSGKHKYGTSENASRRNSGDAYADGDHTLLRLNIIFRDWPRQYGIDNIQGRLTWKKGLSTWRYAPHKKDRQPHGGQSVIKVLCYSDTELNSEPILWIASRIFRVVFSPGKATPLLYWRILLSLMPANWAKRLALIKSKSSKKEGIS